MTRREFLKSIAAGTLGVCAMPLCTVKAYADQGDQRVKLEVNKVAGLFRNQAGISSVKTQENLVKIVYEDGTEEEIEVINETRGYIRDKDRRVYDYYKTDTEFFLNGECISTIESVDEPMAYSVNSGPFGNDWVFVRTYNKHVSFWTKMLGSLSTSVVMMALGIPQVPSIVIGAVIAGASEGEPNGYFRCYEYKFDGLYAYRSRCHVYRDANHTRYVTTFDTGIYEEVDRP